MISNAILYDLVNGEVLARNLIVSESSVPVKINSSYEYFIPYEQYTKPDYDQRYYDYTLIETPLEEIHPLYPIYKAKIWYYKGFELKVK